MWLALDSDVSVRQIACTRKLWLIGEHCMTIDCCGYNITAKNNNIIFMYCCRDNDLVPNIH